MSNGIEAELQQLAARTQEMGQQLTQVLIQGVQEIANKQLQAAFAQAQAPGATCDANGVCTVQDGRAVTQRALGGDKPGKTALLDPKALQQLRGMAANFQAGAAQAPKVPKSDRAPGGRKGRSNPPMTTNTPEPKPKLCKRKDCGKPARAKELCASHYQQAWLKQKAKS